MVEKEAAAHAYSARLAASQPFSRRPWREERHEARALRLAAARSSLSLFFFEDEEAGHRFFLIVARWAVSWDPPVL